MFGTILIAIGLFVAIGFLVAAYVLDRTARSIAAKNTPVQLRVTKLHPKENAFAPEFEVIDGPFAGRRNISNVSSSPPAHMEGDVGAGYINPEPGTIQSEGTLASLRTVGRLFRIVGPAVGGALLVAGLVLVWLGRGAGLATP